METLFKKRINAVIAIIKEIEKTQIMPTTAMFQALLEQEEPKKENFIVSEKTTWGRPIQLPEFNKWYMALET